MSDEKKAVFTPAKDLNYSQAVAELEKSCA